MVDASVIGRVFWVDALTTMGSLDRQPVDAALHNLVGKQLLRRHRQSQLVAQTEMEFWHALVRDVAYGALPRPERAGKHLAYARWLEQVAQARVGDVAEVLAYHTTAALDLAQAAGDQLLAEDVAPLARRHCLLAGQKLAGLDPEQAVRHLDRALKLTPADDPERPAILMDWAATVIRLDRLQDSADAHEEAARAFEEQGSQTRAGLALAHLAIAQLYLGNPRGADTAARAARMLDGAPASRELLDALLSLDPPMSWVG